MTFINGTDAKHARRQPIGRQEFARDRSGMHSVAEMKVLLDALQLIGATPRLLFDKLRIGITMADSADGRIVFANEEFARIVGRPLDQLLTDRCSFLDLTHPHDRERNASLQKLLAGGETDQYELEKRYVRPDGSVVWVKASVNVIQRSKEVTCSIALIEDITARKVLEQQLGTVETVAAIATWNWAVKTDTSTVSHAYNSVHGLPKATPAPSLEEAIRYVHSDDRVRVRKTIEHGVANRSGFTHEYRVILETGDVRWLRTTATCLYDASGEVMNLIGATIDITGVKTRQPVRVVSQALRNALRHIDENWQQPLSMADVGKQFGVSARSIYGYFAAERTTPHRYIKVLKLRRARQLLMHADATTTVTAVALQCGFSNLGHFAKDYRQEFGEAPSDTIKAALL